jgi:hypothetical protein
MLSLGQIYARNIYFHSYLNLFIMASITYGSIITDIKGSIGGISYQSNGGGKIARLRPSPINRASFGQNAVRNKFNTVVASWGQTSLAQKQAWAALALAHPTTGYYGAVKQLNGFQLFNQLNSYRLITGSAISLNAPSYQTPVVPPLYILNLQPSYCYWALQPTSILNNYFYLLYTSLPIGVAVPKNRTNMKLTKIIAPFTGNQINFLSEYLTTHKLSAMPVNNGVNRYIHCYLATLTNNALWPSAFNRQVFQL